MTWVDIQDGESMASVLAKLNALGREAGGGGHARYQTTTGTVSTGIDTWTQLTNNGLGVRTDDDHLPTNVTSMLDTATGLIDTSELLSNDTILVQVEFTLDVLTNATYAELRFQTDEPSGIIDHIVQLGDMNKGTGIYSFAVPHLIDLSGHTLTTKIPVEIRATKACNLQPGALILQVTRGGV
jgi:hypothetical protein